MQFVHTLDVYRENSVEIGFWSTFQVTNVGNSGVVYQDVDASLLEYLVENRVHALMLGHVAAIGFCAPPALDRFRRPVAGPNSPGAAGWPTRMPREC
jgi:hypothetical protein